jgi:hypothetical protein
MSEKVKASILFAASALALGSSAARANESTASPPVESARFAAVSLTKDQGVRAIISNVLVPAKGTNLPPCQVQVSFFNADASLVGSTTRVQLKAGESISVAAVHPPKLVRAIVSIGDVVDPAKVCEIRTSVEIFDVQTDTTFVSIPAGNSAECRPTVARTLAAAHSVSGQRNSAPVPTSSPLSRGTTSPKTGSPVLAATPSTAPR